MKSAAYYFFVLLACSSLAAEGSSIGDFLTCVRSRVIRKVQEALGDGREWTEVSGTVTCAASGTFFLQNGETGVKVLTDGDLPRVGRRVAAAGAPSLEGGRIVFLAKNWKDLGEGTLPPARKVTDDELVDPDPGEGVNWLRVEVEGRAIGVTEGGFAVSVGDVPVNVIASDLPDFLLDCAQTHPKVKVTGVAELMLDPSAFLGKTGYVMGVKIDVGAREDIVLEPDLAYLAACHDRRLEGAIAGAIVLLAAGLAVFAVVVFRQRRGIFRTRTIMAERKRMADDIHDTIEQHLVGAGMLLKIGRLKEAQDVLVRAKREIRDIVWGLKNDDMMRQSPAEMLRQLAHEENTKGLYRIDTRLEGLPETMDAAAMRDLSLIVRESVGNAVKHGGAKKIAVSCDPGENGGWTLRLSNDGTPFDPETAPGAKEGHFGLAGMRQRARRIGADLRFERRGERMVLVLEKRI